MGAQPEPTDNPRAFIEALFGMETRGFVVLAFIPYGGGPAIHAHIPVGRWDIAEREIAHRGATHNCYIGTALYATGARKGASGKMEHRTKGMVGHCRWLYADNDVTPIPDDLPFPTFLVETSPGRQQAWWRLTEPITATEAEDLLRRIAKTCHIGNEAVDCTRILRISGTPNVKPGRPDAMVRRIGGSGEAVAVAEFRALPEVGYYVPTEPTGLVSLVAVDAFALDRARQVIAVNDVPEWLAKMLQGAQGKDDDPSNSDYATMCGLLQLGMTDAEAYAAFSASARGGALRERKGESRYEYLLSHAVGKARRTVGGEAGDAGGGPEPVKERRTYRVWTPDEMMARPPVEYTVSGAVPVGGLVGLVGHSSSYKSFVALDLAMSTAAGLLWLGRETKQCGVLYVSAEGESGMGQRMRAWQIGRSTPCSPHFLTITDAPQLLEGDDVDALIATAEECPLPIGIVVLDTLARTFGGEENSAKEMGQYIAAADRIRRELGCAVVIIHHFNKSGMGARGSSAFYAALDVELTLERDEDQVRLKCTKAKDFAQWEEVSLTREVVAIGSLVSSLVLNLTATGSVAVPGSARRCARLLEGAFGEGGATTTEWMKVCLAEKIDERSFYYARRVLVDASWVNAPERERQIGFRYRLTDHGMRELQGTATVLQPSALQYAVGGTATATPPLRGVQYAVPTGQPAHEGVESEEWDDDDEPF